MLCTLNIKEEINISFSVYKMTEHDLSCKYNQSKSTSYDILRAFASVILLSRQSVL